MGVYVCVCVRMRVWVGVCVYVYMCGLYTCEEPAPILLIILPKLEPALDNV
jgi:hypothetical protein